MQPARLEAPVQLLVEGNDQQNFFEALIAYLQLDGIQVQNFGGVAELRGFLLAIVKAPRFHETVLSIGIVRDADQSAASALQSVQSSLRNAGLGVPDRPEERSDGCPIVTALILPGKNRPGVLETLLCETFKNSPMATCIDTFFDCVEALPDSAKRSDKALARAYLATKERPHLSVGVAAKSGYWNLDHIALDRVRSFLSRL